MTTDIQRSGVSGSRLVEFDHGFQAIEIIPNAELGYIHFTIFCREAARYKTNYMTLKEACEIVAAFQGVIDKLTTSKIQRSNRVPGNSVDGIQDNKR